MRLRRLLPPALVGATLAGCVNLDLTDPNESSTDTFWQTPAQAVAGGNADYNPLEHNRPLRRWLALAPDLRSHSRMLLPPWTAPSHFTTVSRPPYEFAMTRAVR